MTLINSDSFYRSTSTCSAIISVAVASTSCMRVRMPLWCCWSYGRISLWRRLNRERCSCVHRIRQRDWAWILLLKPLFRLPAPKKPELQRICLRAEMIIGLCALWSLRLFLSIVYSRRCQHSIEPGLGSEFDMYEGFDWTPFLFW